MTFTNKMVVDWKGNYRFDAKNEKGLTVSFDAPAFFGGEETALAPMENILASLVACASIHLMSILEEQEQKVSSYKVQVTGERQEEPPRTFTKIHIHYNIKGTGLNRSIIQKAIETAEGNQWSVGTMLKKAVPITSSFEISEA